MKTQNESNTESNYSTYIKDTNNKTSLGLFPLLNFNQNLYNRCKSKYSKYLNNRKNDIKVIINNKLNQKISLNDYILNSNCNELTPIPIMNKRKIKNYQEKIELKNFQRNAVLMRRLEYTNKMKQKKLKQKYNKKISKIIYLQKNIKGYLVRKVIRQVNIIKNTLENFCFLVCLCIQKKYYYILKNRILEIKKITNNLSNNININEYDEKTIKNNNDFYNKNDENYNGIVNQSKNEDISIGKINEINENNNFENENHYYNKLINQSNAHLDYKIENKNELISEVKNHNINNSKTDKSTNNNNNKNNS